MKFRSSQYHVTAVELFVQYKDDPNKVLTRSNYSIMRDLLIHYCLFVSASRDGVLVELLLSELLSGQWVIVETKRVCQVEVYRHKT